VKTRDPLHPAFLVRLYHLRRFRYMAAADAVEHARRQAVTGEAPVLLLRLATVEPEPEQPAAPDTTDKPTLQ